MKNIVIFFLFFAGSAITYSTAAAKIVDRVVAVVNSEVILLSDVEEFKTKLSKGGLVDDALLKLSDSNLLKKDNKLTIQHLINTKILDSEVKKNGMAVTVERVEREINSIAQKNGITYSQLVQALKSQGVDFAEYQDFIKTTLERQSLIEKEISSKIKISDEEVTEYYLRHNKQADNTEYFEYKLAHIILLSKNGGAEAAKQRADEVYAKLKSGQNFDDVAGKFSEDPSFSQGGLLGNFKLNEMNPLVAKALRSLNMGEFTPPIASSGGNFQIYRVLKKSLIPNPALEAQRPKIQAVLFEQAFKGQLTNWLERKRQDAFIRINI